MKHLDSNFWNKYFKVYDTLNQVIPYQELLNDLVTELDVKKGDLILDAGSGTGNLTIKLEKLGAKVIALDNNSEAIKRHKQKNPKAEIIQHDLNKPLPFKDNYFDKIVCNNVLYIIPKDKRINLLNELFRVLKDEGKIVLANPTIKASPIKILISHLNSRYCQKGLINILREFFSLINSVILLLYYNLIIKFNSKIFYSKFIGDEEQKKLLSKKFTNITKTKFIYARQAILNSAQKNIQHNINMSSLLPNIIIRIPQNQDEYIKSCKLIERVYQEHGYIEYFQSNPSILFTSIDNNIILGTIGLIVRGIDYNGKFPTENVFNFYFTDFIKNNNIRVVEISRLATMGNQTFGLTRGLFLAVYKYVCKFNIDYCIAMIKPDLFDIIKNKLHIPIHRINKQICKKNIPKCYEGYFLHNPMPIPIYIKTRETTDIFKKIENDIGSRIDIIIDNINSGDGTTNFKNLN